MREDILKDLREALAQEVKRYDLINLYEYIFINLEQKAGFAKKKQKELDSYTPLGLATIKRMLSGKQVSVDTACRFILSFPISEQELIDCLAICLGIDFNTKVYCYYRFAIRMTFKSYPIPDEQLSSESYSKRNRKDCKARREYYEFIISNEKLIKPKYLPPNNALNK